ncbi:hypothetical protein ACFQ3L_07620 [Lacticaseibacillus jixianensis]|uniref:WxL domain-containing protein n=1 Tax=Lacticaseibacillus jixianensis TaxID=2486012 RepID=A0ABW4BAL9_9LACO|nr:hypothetical protein [Lacticaseibacillus jixianensis]
MRWWRGGALVGALAFAALCWLDDPQQVWAADVTVPTNIPAGFDQPTGPISGAQFRTQPNWYTHGYIVSLADPLGPSGQEQLPVLADPPELDPYGAPEGSQYYYAIVHNGETLPMKASFDKSIVFFFQGVKLQTKFEQGDGPVVTSNSDLGVNEAVGITDNFGAVGAGEEYDYIDYLLTFPPVTVPTWFRYQIDVETQNSHTWFHSNIFPVLVIPDNWVPQLSASPRVLFAGQPATVGVAGLDQTLQPEYTWDQPAPAVTPTGNQLTVTNTPATVGMATVRASFTVPAHPMWGGAVTYSGPPLTLYMGRFADQTVNFHDDAQFNVVLPPGLSVDDATWQFDQVTQAGSGLTLTIPEAEQGGSVHWQATLRNLSGEVIEAAADAQLQIIYPDVLTLLNVPDLTFMRQVGGILRPPTVQEIMAGEFGGDFAPTAVPALGEDSPWLVARGGPLTLVDGRSDSSVPWRLAVRLGAFHSQQASLDAHAEMMLLLTDEKEVVHTPPHVVAGSDNFITIASRPDGAGRNYEYAVQGLLALAADRNPVAGTYSATVDWELAAVPEPSI